MAQDRIAAEKAIERRAQRDAIAGIATPAGEGALGILRVAGPISSLFELVGRELEARRATKIAFADDTGLIDEAIAVFYPGDASPIGEDLLELTLHGSPYILNRALFRALKRARLAAPGEFTRRAFLNGKIDLTQAEAVCALIRARTESAHRAALRQLSGGLTDEIVRLREPLFDLLVRIEACLDHPEEDIPSLRAEEALAALDGARAPIERLAATFERGRLCAEGARLALVGRPNAGKSSLLNALVGRARAIVRPEPGTTRDTLEEPLELAGLPAVLVDTAGLREDCADPAEREGVARAEAALETCDAAVLVVDGSRPMTEEDARAHERVAALAARRGAPVVMAVNKADLKRGSALAGGVAVSAVTGEGLDALRARLSETLAPRAPAEAIVVTSARHARELAAAAAELARARETVVALPRAWEDRAASSLREAIHRLGVVLGYGAPEDALDAVFSRFCVGK